MKIASVAHSALAVALAAAAATPAIAQTASAPTAANAKQFVDDAAAAYLDQVIRQARAEWVYSTFINQDTEALNAEQEAILTKMQVSNAA